MSRLLSVTRAVRDRLDTTVGGPARRHVVLVFACVLALDSADKATVGTSATQLQSALGIGKTQLGLLLTVTSLASAAATIPFGMLVDRVIRTRLLAIGVACWTVASGLSGLAPNYDFLLGTRALLGVVMAVASPAVASLIGDYFGGNERGRIYGYVLSGELVGAGVGFMITGQFASLSWRAPFIAMIAPSLFVLWLVWRLPEPARGGRSRLLPGAQGIDVTPRDDAEELDHEEGEAGSRADGDAHRAVRTNDVTPRAAAVLDHEPATLPLWDAVRYVLSVRTNVVLIVASGLGYFFFSGLRGFAVEFAKQHYGVSQHEATVFVLVIGIGALSGVLVGGRLADRLLERGRLAARPEVSGVAVLLAASLFVPAVLTSAIPIALPLLVLAALCLGATNPPLDAARLDIIHPVVWGRASAVRTAVRTSGDAAAPLIFGFVSSSVFSGTAGLQYTFLIMLAALFTAALITLVFGRRTYPSDVAAAVESLERFPGDGHARRVSEPSAG